MLKISCLSSIIFCLFLVACQAGDSSLSLSKKTLDPPPQPATACTTDSHNAVTPTRDPQTPALYAILVADTCDRTIGDSVNQDIQNIEKLLDTIATQTHLQLIKQIVKGDKLSYQEVTQTVNRLSIQPNDVVIFYYSGHGARSSDKQTQWPSLCVEGVGHCIYEDKRLDLDWVVKVVREQKQPRLFIALADACNNVVNFRPPKSETTRNLYAGVGPLFLESQGYIIASGSIPGEFSYGTELGGYFTNAWLKDLQEAMIQPTSANTWYTIMGNATRPLPVPGGQQHPQKEVQVWPVENKTVPPPPPPPVPAILLPPTTLTLSPPPPLSPGQAMQVQIRTAIDGYLLLYDADRTQSQQIFPNATTSQKGLKTFPVTANRNILIPDPEIYELDFQLVTPNIGKRFLIALVATDPTQLTQLQSLLPQAIAQVLTTLTSTTEVTQALSQWLQKSGNVTGSGWSVGVVEYEVK